MKRIAFGIMAGAIVVASSCTKKMDINANPNNATSATPQVLLPQAITQTANVLNSYNTYGAQVGGYMANAGGYGGFGSNVTYNWSSSDYQGLWSSTYDNLNDFQLVIRYADSIGVELGYFAGAARIMKSYDFQMLVDTYNDLPYNDAFKGTQNLTPAYDAATDVYKALADNIDEALAIINETEASTGEVKSLGTSDPLFNGDMTKWKQLANTVKLRLIIRANGKVNFSNTDFDDAGFLSTDALINPGFTRDNGKQNPIWNTWVYTYTGATTNRAWMPTKWALSFYNATKLDDPRGYVLYNGFPSTGANQLGFEGNNVPSSPAGSNWFSHINEEAVTDAGSSGNSIGALKGPNAGFPALTAAESYFLQAEAVVRGIIDGDADALFNSGLLASYQYLYTLPNGQLSADPAWVSPSGDLEAYKEWNPDTYLVHFELAETDEEKLEAILTQKYIALNMVNSQEGYFEYLRTGYPKIVAGSDSPTESFASLQSVSTRPDKLPARILYPTAETNYNGGNVPKSIDPFTSKIFWAK
ncbi:SusD/RagB family nutrient-binding outer membrane lipoprotein [Flavihumibacter petaseus]|uniref:SusD/RagB family protein n=1 Tax=Flavihumibacter petaseus NBRC 106054 TaxID=1220578 RepID=A0A0E9N7B8_9BACT|nr:SusD/RagB family nutrient-binding outer membrane lipoprotein [Flavihumibacter petaseus]GAO45596.1 hypothetical protein FPE01S_06_00870 [Flavihumibacter petaseus NBRC 106054]